MIETSPGPTSNSLPSAIATCSRPVVWYAKWADWQSSVPASDPTLSFASRVVSWLRYEVHDYARKLLAVVLLEEVTSADNRAVRLVFRAGNLRLKQAIRAAGDRV